MWSVSYSSYSVPCVCVFVFPLLAQRCEAYWGGADRPPEADHQQRTDPSSSANARTGEGFPCMRTPFNTTWDGQIDGQDGSEVQTIIQTVYSLCLSLNPLTRHTASKVCLRRSSDRLSQQTAPWSPSHQVVTDFFLLYTPYPVYLVLPDYYKTA